MSAFAKELRPQEVVVREGSVSTTSLLSRAVVLAVIVGGYWIFMQWLTLATAGSSSPLSAVFAPMMRLFTLALTLLITVAAVYTLVVILLRSAFTRYALTDSRVMRRSFLRMRGADLAHVQDVEVVQDLLGKMLGYGDVVIRTASTQGTIVLRWVDHPHDWYRHLHDTIRRRQTSTAVSG